MRRLTWVAAMALSCGLVFAQDEPQADYKKMYADALVQLKQAQERKNELALEKADVEKKLDSVQTKLDEANRVAAGYAGKTFFLRAHYAAWQEFVSHSPKIQQQWDIFLAGASESTTSPTTQQLIDTDWPLSAMK
jgi:hypothetical protein